ncbi:MAG: hypothetical protein M1814_006716 [Vezdaea aestivalis]|nr:MAG: hypothetical protein M1814_006716 [Vezdaea aestivalis]
MAQPIRSRNTSTWSRLKPVNQDPLEAIGLVSKGDTRLLDPKTQQQYFQRIQERWLDFCSQASSQSTSSAGPPPQSHVLNSALPSPDALTTALQALNLDASASSSSPNSKHRRSLSIITMSLRKLREALLSNLSKTSAPTSLHHDVYTFSIRFGILTHQPSAFAASLSHLLFVLHPLLPLPTPTLREMRAYYILDLAARQTRYADAFAQLHRTVMSSPSSRSRSTSGGGLEASLYALPVSSTESRAGLELPASTRPLVSAIVHGHYNIFFALLQQADGHTAAVLAPATKRMQEMALKTVGRAYHAIDVGYLQRCLGGMLVEEAKRVFGVGWESAKDERGRDIVVVRRVKGR